MSGGIVDPVNITVVALVKAKFIQHVYRDKAAYMSPILYVPNLFSTVLHIWRDC
jgi:hypothetical protein